MKPPSAPRELAGVFVLRDVAWLNRPAVRCAPCTIGLLLVACGSTELPAGISEPAMDRTADPCVDFYQYACGGFLASHRAGSSGAWFSRLDPAISATERAVDKILQLMGTSDPRAVLLDQYQSTCLAAAVSTDRSHLKRLLAKIDAITPDAGLAPAMAGLHAAGVDALFGLQPTADPLQPRRPVAELYDTGISLPDRFFYVDPAAAGVLGEYAMHLEALSALLGVNDPELARAAIAVETALATAMPPAGHLRDPSMTLHPTDLATFAQSHPAFDWSAYLAATGAPPITSLNVTQPGYFAALDGLLATVPFEDLRRYLRWRALESVALQSEDAVVNEETLFHLGFPAAASVGGRYQLCLRNTLKRLKWEISSLYTQLYAKGTAAAVQPMVDDIRGQLWDQFGRLDWLDDATRGLVRAKLDAMHLCIASPADYGPYLLGEVMLPADFPSAEAARYAAVRAKELALIGGTDERDWFMSPTTVNAAYIRDVNSINLPAAILQAPLYSARYAEAVNLGAIGAVVGHEITHGFDDEGRHFDASGVRRDMWTPKVHEEFDARARCVAAQYSAIEVDDGGLHLDGELTLDENIADLGGVKLAYQALAPTGERAGALTDAQAFFLAYGQSWCESLSPDVAGWLLRFDPHSPAKARVNAVLADSAEFATAWSCREGQPMAPVHRCTVW